MYTRIKNILGSFGDRQVSRETAVDYYDRFRRAVRVFNSTLPWVSFEDPFFAISDPRSAFELGNLVISGRVGSGNGDEALNDSMDRNLSGSVEYRLPRNVDIDEAVRQFCRFFGVENTPESMKCFIDGLMSRDSRASHTRCIPYEGHGEGRVDIHPFGRRSLSNSAAWPMIKDSFLHWDYSERNCLLKSLACVWYNQHAKSGAISKRDNYLLSRYMYLIPRLFLDLSWNIFWGLLHVVAFFCFSALFLLSFSFVSLRLVTPAFRPLSLAIKEVDVCPEADVEAMFIVNDAIIESAAMGHVTIDRHNGRVRYRGSGSCAQGYRARLNQTVSALGYVQPSLRNRWIQEQGVVCPENGKFPLFAELIQQALPFDSSSRFDRVKYANFLIHQAQVAKRNKNDTFVYPKVLCEGVGILMQNMDANGAVTDDARNEFIGFIQQKLNMSCLSKSSAISGEAIGGQIKDVFEQKLPAVSIRLKISDLCSESAFKKWLKSCSEDEKKSIKTRIAKFEFRLQSVSDENLGQKIWGAAIQRCRVAAKAEQASQGISAAQAQQILELDSIDSLKSVCMPNLDKFDQMFLQHVMKVVSSMSNMESGGESMNQLLPVLLDLDILREFCGDYTYQDRSSDEIKKDLADLLCATKRRVDDPRFTYLSGMLVEDSLYYTNLVRENRILSKMNSFELRSELRQARDHSADRMQRYLGSQKVADIGLQASGGGR